MTPPDPPGPNRQFKEWLDQWNRAFTARAWTGEGPTFQWEVTTDQPQSFQPSEAKWQQPMIRRTVTPEGDEVIIVKAPYNAAFVNALKAEVDPDSRRWNPEEKVWVIDSAYEKLVRGLADRHFGRERSGPKPDPSPRGASGITIEKAYRLVQAKAEELQAEPTIESLAAEVSRLTYELETERQLRAAAEAQRSILRHSAEVLTGELRRVRGERDAFERGLKYANAQTEALEREVDRLTRSSIFGGAFHFDGTAPSPSLSDAYRVLGVLPDLPLEIVEVVYRRLAAKHHPDVGGDPERMKQINMAMNQVRAAKQQRS